MGAVGTCIVVVQPHLLLLRHSVEASSQVERHYKKDHRDARHDRVGFCPHHGRLIVWKGGEIEFGGTGPGVHTQSRVSEAVYQNAMRVRHMCVNACVICEAFIITVLRFFLFPPPSTQQPAPVKAGAVYA
jgi:hypothetical protein